MLVRHVSMKETAIHSSLINTSKDAANVDGTRINATNACNMENMHYNMHHNFNSLIYNMCIII